eukprot:357312_1
MVQKNQVEICIDSKEMQRNSYRSKKSKKFEKKHRSKKFFGKINCILCNLCISSKKEQKLEDELKIISILSKGNKLLKQELNEFKEKLNSQQEKINKQKK